MKVIMNLKNVLKKNIKPPKDTNNYKNTLNYFWKNSEKKKPIFTNTSFGFRSNQGVHKTLLQIKTYWTNLNYFVQCAVKKAFDKLNHSILIKILEENIYDKRVINEIWKMLNVKRVDFRFQSLELFFLNIPQDSILSPLLFNIYMTKLDNFVTKIMKNTEKTTSAQWNNYWYKTKIKFLKKWNKTKTDKQLYLNKSKKFSNVVKKHWIRKKIVKNLTSKLYYVRYADNFLIGFKGKKHEAKEQLKNIKNYIKFNLHLNCTNFKLINAQSDTVKYLGFRLRLAKKNINKSRYN